jgi:hypothetical protein
MAFNSSTVIIILSFRSTAELIGKFHKIFQTQSHETRPHADAIAFQTVYHAQPRRTAIHDLTGDKHATGHGSILNLGLIRFGVSLRSMPPHFECAANIFRSP